MWVLDAFRPRGATWLGQVISSPPGPSGGPSKTHLLPGGGVPRVHRARSLVPPRLPLFATPRSVRPSADVAAGAYPPRRPPNAWSPGVPALPGPCYWLVTSGTPVGWRGGCLALGLVRGAMRHYCLGRCSALVVCVRRLRPVRGGWGRCRVLCLPFFPLPAPRFLRCVWRAVPSGCPLSSLAGTPFHAVSAFRGLGPVALLVVPACPLCVCALALSRRPHAPLLPGLVWRAHLAQSRRWALLGLFHSVCAPPHVQPRSRAPFGLLRGGRPGPISPYLTWGCALPVGWVRTWGPVSNPTARALASWPCALAWRAVGAARGRPGGAPRAWVRGARGRALSHPRPLVLSGVRPGPTTHWLWMRGVPAQGPVTNPTARALASWLCALWGRHEGARGGRFLPGCGVSGVGRSPTPNQLSVRACGRGPLPCGCGCRGFGRGDPSTTPQRALLRAGFARCRGGMRVPGGGASCLGVGRPGSGALPAPTTCPFGRAAGAHYPLAVGAGAAGMGTRHQPHSARSCELALRAVGAARGRPGGAPPAWVWGVRGRALSHLRPLDRSGVRPGPTTHLLWVRGLRAWGPVTNSTARTLASWLCRLWGRHEGARGGASCLGVGRPGSGALRPPTTSPFGRASGAHYPLAVGAGGAGVGTRHQAHSARSCELALRAVGVARGRPGGAPLAWVWGVWGRALSYPRPLVRSGVRPGPTTHWLWVRRVRASGPVTSPTARALASWLCALWGRHEGARRGCLLPACGASGVGRSPNPDLSSVQACGRGPLPTGCGCGGCGRGNSSPTPQRALL